MPRHNGNSQVKRRLQNSKVAREFQRVEEILSRLNQPVKQEFVPEEWSNNVTD